MPNTEPPPPTPQDQALATLAATLRQSGYRFTTPTPRTHQTVNARPQNVLATNLQGIFGWSRPFAASILPPNLFALAKSAAALTPQNTLWRSRYRLSTLDNLAFLHTAHPTQHPDAVFFGPDTYRFARALRHYLTRTPPANRAVDIGCGAGAGAMLIAQAWPNTAVTMLDINPEALRLARINAQNANLTHIKATQSDLLAATTGAFDLIVANPPYLPDPLKRAYRDGGEHLGAALSLRIITEAIARLAPGGTLLLYTGTAIVDGENPFLHQATHLLTQAGFAWTAEELDPDVFGEELEAAPMAAVDRIAILWLTARRPPTDTHHA